MRKALQEVQMTMPATYHRCGAGFAGANVPYGTPPSKPRHPAFDIGQLRPYEPQLLTSEQLANVTCRGGPTRSCATSWNRCRELEEGRRDEPGKRGWVCLKHWRAKASSMPLNTFCFVAVVDKPKQRITEGCEPVRQCLLRLIELDPVAYNNGRRVGDEATVPEWWFEESGIAA
jgi:hypothetical protein